MRASTPPPHGFALSAGSFSGPPSRGGGYFVNHNPGGGGGGFVGATINATGQRRRRYGRLAGRHARPRRRVLVSAVSEAR